MLLLTRFTWNDPVACNYIKLTGQHQKKARHRLQNRHQLPKQSATTTWSLAAKLKSSGSPAPFRETLWPAISSGCHSWPPAERPATVCVWPQLRSAFFGRYGAEVSVLPAISTDKLSTCRFKLSHGQSHSHSHIKLYNILNINNRRFAWNFTIADVPQLLLGADVLRSNNLLVDLRGRKLDSETFASITCGRVTGDAPHLAAISTVDNPYAKILALFPGIITPTFSQTTTKHNVEHFTRQRARPYILMFVV